MAEHEQKLDEILAHKHSWRFKQISQARSAQLNASHQKNLDILHQLEASFKRDQEISSQRSYQHPSTLYTNENSANSLAIMSAYSKRSWLENQSRNWLNKKQQSFDDIIGFDINWDSR